MATTVRGGGGGAGAGKEKKGTSLSTSSSHTKKSPKPSSSTLTLTSTSSSSSSCEKTTLPPDNSNNNKPIPNYLKPTISSSLDFSRIRIRKRSTIDSPTQKPVLDRRSSLGRLSSSSQGERDIRGAPGAREIKHARSSSFSIKSNAISSSSTRPGSSTSDRSSVRTLSKVDPPHLSKSRTLRRSTLPSTSIGKAKDLNRGSSSLSTKKGPRSVTSESSINDETHLVLEDDMVSTEQEVDSLPEISEMPGSDSDLGDPTELKHAEEDHIEVALKEDNDNDDHHNEEKSVGAEHIAEEPAAQKSRTVDRHDEEKGDQTAENQADEENVEESPEHHDEEKEDLTAENQAEQESAEESAEHQPKVESAEQNHTGEGAGERDEVHQEAPKAGPTEASREEKKEEESTPQEAQKGTEETEAKNEEQTVTSPAVVAATNSTAAVPVKAQPASKKEEKVYNDVIEETANKLMRKKNKVLALAGAFETVISLQDTNKN